MDNQKYLDLALHQKYRNMMRGSTYKSQFSKTDAHVLYDVLARMGVQICTPHQKQKTWEAVKLNTDWYTATENNPVPTKRHGVDETKHRLFKSWLMEQRDLEINLKDLIKRHLKKIEN